AQFGAGCSRWLQFVVGGHGELGKTPSWLSIDEFRHELGRENLQLDANQARLAAISLGATHFVTSRMTSKSGVLSISYEVMLLADPSPIAQVSLNGDPAAITKGLPGAAAKIARALGVGTPRVPQVCAAGPAGLRLMGRSKWFEIADATDESCKAYREIAM